MKHIVSCILLLSYFLPIPLSGYSPRRKRDPHLPRITTQWAEGGPTYSITDSHIEEYPIFAEHSRFIEKYKLPRGPITFHLPETDIQKSVRGDTLSMLISNVVQEIYQGKKIFTHFTTLQSKNFSSRQSCGLIVLKFKDYPFVLKLFIETPQTFIDPYCKGIEPTFFFFMSGGANRHLAGLTRIKNKVNLEKKVNQLDRWRSMIQFPRKWYWTPLKQRWITIRGERIGKYATIKTRLPHMYGIVADAIETEKTEPLPRYTKKSMVMELCNDLNLLVDPHYTNYIFQREKKTNKVVIVIVDTEHFPTMVGIKEKQNFPSHTRWYSYLGRKAFSDIYQRTKKQRQSAQFKTHDKTVALCSIKRSKSPS